MSLLLRTASRLRLIALTAGLVLGSACDDSPVSTPADPPGSVTAVILALGPTRTTVVLNADGSVSGAPARLEPDPYSSDDDTRLKATLLSPPGTSLPPLADYELRVSPSDTTMVGFLRSAPLEGALARKRSGTTSIVFTLVESTSGRVLLGPHIVPFTVER
jgi:hypothetical protein